MPTIFEQNGYRVMVFLSEHPPPHVHVIHDNTSIPVLIDPEKATWRGDSDGRKPQQREIRKAVRIIAGRMEECLAAWDLYHAS